MRHTSSCSGGLSVLYTASEPLVSGTDAVVDALMDMVEAQLEESDISVDLTADNYKEELERSDGRGEQCRCQATGFPEGGEGYPGGSGGFPGRDHRLHGCREMRSLTAAGNCGMGCRNCRMKPMI